MLLAQQVVTAMALAWILWGTLMTLAADALLNTNFSLLPPVNLTIQELDLARILLHWKPNPAQEFRAAELGYHVIVHAPHQSEDDAIKIQDTKIIREVALHLGLSARVCTVLWADGICWHTSQWAFTALEAPPGVPGTAAMNLTCNTVVWEDGDSLPRPSSLHVSLQCSWQVCKEAPTGLQYFLRFRYSTSTQECQSYDKDSLGRNVGCSIPRTLLSPKMRGLLAVRVRGFSPQVAVQPLEQLFALPAIDRVNPPRNLTATVDGHLLSVRWEKPLSAFAPHCFEYEVCVLNLRTGHLQRERLKVPAFVSLTDGASQLSIRVRAAVGTNCRMAGSWGMWSQSIQAGHDELWPPGDWLWVGIAAAICLCLLGFMLFCWMCPLWVKVLPPVPGPKDNVAEFLMAASEEANTPTKVRTCSLETREALNCIQEPGLQDLEDSGL